MVVARSTRTGLDVRVDIRPATPADTVAWLELRRALFGTEDDNHAAEIAAYFDGTAREPLAVLMAFDDTAAAIGLAELSIRAYAEGCRTDRVAYLEGWYVAPHVRRQGVGKALVTAAEQWGRAQGCTEFASDAMVDNDTSAAAHRAAGFTDVGLIRCFRKDH